MPDYMAPVAARARPQPTMAAAPAMTTQGASPLAQLQRDLNDTPRVRQLYAMAGTLAHGGVIQRVEIARQQDTADSIFDIDMKEQESLMHEGQPTMATNISFKLKPAYPRNANPVVLDQVVRASHAETHEVSSWKGFAEDRRDAMMTGEDHDGGVEGGWFVDHMAADRKPRNKAADAIVPTDYISSSLKYAQERDLPDLGLNVHGSKVGEESTAAKMYDAPASATPYDFRAEVVAKGTEGGNVVKYASLVWGFKTKKDEDSQEDKGKIDTAYADFTAAPSPTYDAAMVNFHRQYHNPESATSPERINALIEQIKALDGQGNLAASAALKVQLHGVFSQIMRESTEADEATNQIQEASARFVSLGPKYKLSQAEADAHVGQLPDHAEIQQAPPQIQNIGFGGSSDDEGDGFGEFHSAGQNDDDGFGEFQSAGQNDGNDWANFDEDL